MNKSAHLRDFTQPWTERRKNCVQDTIKCISTTPAFQTPDELVLPRRSIASSSSAVTVTQPMTSTSIASKLKHRTEKKQRRLPLIHVKLAQENAPSEHSDSDSSCYDSLNEMETDFCRDESDYSDGYVTDGFATMDVFEYEVDDSSESEDFYSHGSSSGTDDMVEVVARALFDSSSSSDSDIEILAQDADTEESDAPTDPELGRADYWECIKCKNKKNNPMYRFCEKCYQIRKNYFPPRPKKRQRKRASLANRDGSKLFSSPSTSSCISPNDENQHQEDGRISRNSSDGSDEMGNEYMQKSKQTRKQRRRTTSQPQNHSAGESSCCSSQELSPDEQQSTLPSNYMACASSSQETYCSDLEHIVNVNKQSNSNLFEHNYPNSQESVYPNSEPSISNVSGLDNVFDSNRALSKLDSLASTVSSFSVGSSQSSTECDSNRTQNAVVPELKSCDSFNGSISEKASTAMDVAIVGANKKKSKKRKLDFTDEISDCDIDDDDLMAKKFRTMDETDSTNGMCMICLSEPKNGAFVHNRFLHVCCCYRCTVKVWNKRKRCPICNSQVKTVLKMFVH
ncbi:E3 ubiquitin-protein ligase Mdm2-like [Contarinia nasturtii]|uniref:E3 ubiquitin-protein ligase Mdm2-like n=1 Tax=Contarinia nasturtii TaxID=265458 RepID=UPI0012D3D741|nr:E3 ubiquitin-protein ligase Mdm2-like [Contarinia nasturtii]